MGDARGFVGAAQSSGDQGKIWETYARVRLTRQTFDGGESGTQPKSGRATLKREELGRKDGIAFPAAPHLVSCDSCGRLVVHGCTCKSMATSVRPLSLGRPKRLARTGSSLHADASAPCSLFVLWLVWL